MKTFKKKKKFQSKRLSIIVNRTLCWIHKNFKGSCGARQPREYAHLVRLQQAIHHRRGWKGLISFNKAVRTALLRFLGKEPLKSPYSVSLYKDGIPKCLGPELASDIRRCDRLDFKSLNESGLHRNLAVMMTILTSSRVLKPEVIPDLKPIEQESSMTLPSLVGKDMKSFWQALGFKPFTRLPKLCRWRKYHFTTKAGPNSTKKKVNAMATALDDLYSLPKETIESIKTVGGPELSKLIDTLMDPRVKVFTEDLFPNLDKEGVLRRLTYFPDKEGKSRVVAILDYFSQTALKPLHKFLYARLRTIPQDCTFDQGSFRTKIEGCPIYYSVDLTAATDRFPIRVISSLLKAVFPEDYVQA
jgi:hypothetical protein